MANISFKKTLAKLLEAVKKPSFEPKTTYVVTNSDSIEFENGLIIKYGAVAGKGGTAGNTSAAGCNQRVVFPTPFPNNCFFVMTGIAGIGPTASAYTSVVNSSGWDKNGFYATAYGLSNTHAASSTANNCYWTTGYLTYIAIGN